MAKQTSLAIKRPMPPAAINELMGDAFIPGRERAILL